jgi:putative oxidoreductase
MADLGLLLLRLTLGTLMAGHGAQKLFGWFKGPGLKGTHGMMETLGMKPANVWGTVAALGEFNGGVLTALGFLNPLGPLNIVASMTVATRRVHWNKPIWASQGGAELPITNLAAALMIATTGPGRFSLDRVLGIRMPRWLAGLTTVSILGVVIAALQRPEVAETLMRKVTDVVSPSSTQPITPDLEVETRPHPTQEPTPAAPGDRL